MIDPGASKVPRTLPGGLGIGKRASRESEEPGKACTFPEVRRSLGWGWCKVLSWGQQKRKLDGDEGNAEGLQSQGWIWILESIWWAI